MSRISALLVILVVLFAEPRIEAQMLNGVARSRRPPRQLSRRLSIQTEVLNGMQRAVVWFPLRPTDTYLFSEAFTARLGRAWDAGAFWRVFWIACRSALPRWRAGAGATRFRARRPQRCCWMAGLPSVGIPLFNERAQRR